MTVAKQSSDLQTGTLSQRVTACLLQDFDFDAHLAKLTQVYGQRCDAMLQALDSYMPAGTRWTHPQGGMFVWVELPRQLRAEDLFPHAIANKVAFVPGSGFFAGERLQLPHGQDRRRHDPPWYCDSRRPGSASGGPPVASA
jgi:2-aminoadipate transaminase